MQMLYIYIYKPIYDAIIYIVIPGFDEGIYQSIRSQSLFVVIRGHLYGTYKPKYVAGIYNLVTFTQFIPLV